MHKLREVKTPLYKKALNLLSLAILQIAVMLTFLGVVPLIILIYISIFKEMYLDTFFLCGALLTLVKTNRMIQGGK